MPNRRVRLLRVTHVAEVPNQRPLLGPNIARRLPARSVNAKRLELGIPEGRPGVALRLWQSDGVDQCEVHESIALAIGQAEFEFGVPPSAWKPVTSAATSS